MTDKRDYNPSVEQIAKWMKNKGWVEITSTHKDQKQFAMGDRRITILNNPMPTEYRVLLGRLGHLYQKRAEALRVEIAEIKIAPIPGPEKPRPYVTQRMSDVKEYKAPPEKTMPYWRRR